MGTVSTRVLLVPHRLHDPFGTGIHPYGVELIRARPADATDIDASRITVIPEGVDPIFRRPVSEVDVAAVCARHRIRPGRFFLFVGAISGRKNLVTAMRALAAFRARGPDVPLVVAGPRGRGAEEFDAEAARLGLQSAVRVTGFISAADLPVLLAAALALVHPSKYEGFGLTLIES